MDYKERYKLWLKNVKDETLLKELKSMNEEEIETAFFKDIEFGTAGMRGTLGAGSNCMNKYNVAKVTKAICEFLKSYKNPSIAVSYDSRNMSFEFAELVTKICAYNGVKVYLAQTMMPTPFLSYMVRFYQTDMGVMITASHNPKEYNGYKVYGNDGCQLLDKPSLEIMELAEKINPFSVEECDFEKACKDGLVVFTDSKILDSYTKEVLKQSVCDAKNLKVVYTALNGTGIKTLPETLKKVGVDVILNEVQCKADGNFTTCPYPNPERIDVYDLSNKIAIETRADLVIASDPDADRVGVNVINNNEITHLTGNEVGVLLIDFLLANKKYKSGIVVKSIVSTSLAEKVANNYGAEVYNVLTGFKYIGEYIARLEKEKTKEFVLGFEESLGYLVGTYVRDKDATVASMLICEMASKYKAEGKTLVDKLNEIYVKFGLYEHFVLRFDFPGEEGFIKMESILDNLRKNSPKNFGTLKVKKVLDYESGVGDLPKANIMSFELEGESEIIIRPSGTEPLIKTYITLSKTKEVNTKNKTIIENAINEIMK